MTIKLTEKKDKKRIELIPETDINNFNELMQQLRRFMSGAEKTITAIIFVKSAKIVNTFTSSNIDELTIETQKFMEEYN